MRRAEPARRRDALQVRDGPRAVGQCDTIMLQEYQIRLLKRLSVASRYLNFEASRPGDLVSPALNCQADITAPSKDQEQVVIDASCSPFLAKHSENRL